MPIGWRAAVGAAALCVTALCVTAACTGATAPVPDSTTGAASAAVQASETAESPQLESPQPESPPAESPPAATAASASTAPRTGAIAAYRNARFGYSLALPTWLTSAAGESDNGDGITLSGRGVTVSVFGWNVIRGMPDSVPTPQRVRDRWTAKGATITYQGGSTAAFSISGTLQGSVFYERYLVGSGSCVGLTIGYPASAKADGDAAVGQAVVSLAAGNLTQPH